MSTPAGPASGRAAELRREFDRAFSEPVADRVARFEDLLAIGVGPHPFAVRLDEILGLYADKAITPLPSPVQDLVGLAGFRGALVPVYDLRALLGHPATEAARWLVLVRTGASSESAAPQLALAFDRFEGHLRVAPDALAAEPARDRSSYVHEVVRDAGIARPVVHLRTVVSEITKRAQQHRIPQRER